MPYAAQRQFRCTVSGIPGYWSAASGYERESQTTQVYDGGRPQASVVTSNVVHANIETKRPFDPAASMSWLPGLRQAVGKSARTIVRWAIDEDEQAIGGTEITVTAKLVKITDPEFDAASNDAGMIMCTWAVEDFD